MAVSKRLAPSVRRDRMELMERTPEIVSWLETRLGDYPFGQTGGLTTSLQPGFSLENQTRPTYSTGIGLNTVVHELAHQWFGDSVAVHGWRDIWLNEGFATFMEAAYAEAHDGQDAQKWLEQTWQAFPQEDPYWMLPIGDPGPKNIFAWAVYTRGSMTLQALRHRVGESAFWTILRTWVADREGGNGTTEEFQALAEQVSGEDLDGFFTAWLVTGERPAHTARPTASSRTVSDVQRPAQPRSSTFSTIRAFSHAVSDHTSTHTRLTSQECASGPEPTAAPTATAA